MIHFTEVLLVNILHKKDKHPNPNFARLCTLYKHASTMHPKILLLALLLPLAAQAAAQKIFPSPKDCRRLPPDTLYHEWIDDTQLVVIDHYSSWTAYTDCQNAAKPMGTDWRMCTPRQRNIYLFRNRKNEILYQYGGVFSQSDLHKLRPTSDSSRLQSPIPIFEENPPFIQLKSGTFLLFETSSSDRGMLGSFGIVDMRGKLILPADYSHISADEKYIICHTKTGKIELRDHDFRPLPEFGNGLKSLRPSSEYPNLYIGIDSLDLYRLFDEKMRFISGGYRHLDGFIFGQARAIRYTRAANGQETRCIGLLDSTGREFIPCEYNEVRHFRPNSKATAVQKGEKWGAIDRNNKPLTEFKYEFVNTFHRGYAQVRLGAHGSPMGLINESGKEIIAPDKYRYIGTEFNCGLIEACEGRNCGYLDEKGNVVIPLIYSNVWGFQPNLQKAQVQKDGKTFFINAKGEKIN